MMNSDSMIIDGANPSMLWYNIADYIGKISKSMVKTYNQRQRSNKPITWGELDKVNQDLHNQLDIIISGDRNVKTISENKTMSKKQVIRINESQLRQIVTESVKRVLKESQYSDLSQDDWDNLYRNANDISLRPDYHRFEWKKFSLKGVNKGFDKQVEQSDPYAFYQSEEEALNDGLKHLKKYSEGVYIFYLSDSSYELREIEIHNGKIIRDERID